jgi:hypothetical protein
VTHHDAWDVVIKTASVDKGVAPVVKWLNSFDGIVTRWSCEGDGGNDPPRKPYVLFYCEDPMDLIRVAKRDNWGISVHYYEPSGGLRYVLEFPNAAALNYFSTEQ